jgi:hypothetical protein
LADIKKLVAAVDRLEQTQSRQYRYTPGAAMLVSGIMLGPLPASMPRAEYRVFSSRMVLVRKKDILTATGALDRNRRLGGWGGVSGEIGQRAGGKWTARSGRTLRGILRKASHGRR